MAEPLDRFDVVVVGAGPGGVAAAVTAAEAGRCVCLIDDAAFAGGQIWRNRGVEHRPREARAWLERLDRAAITRWTQSRVIAVPSPGVLLVETPDGPRRVAWRSLVLATGARELFLPFPGWTLPGVVGAGGMQALVKQGLPVAGKRIVVAGTGPLLLAVADLMKRKGAIVPSVLEQTPTNRLNRFGLSLVSRPKKLLAGVWLRARLLGSGYTADAYPLRVTRSAGGLRIDYRVGTWETSVDCDYFACGFNLIPNNELPQVIGCETDGDGFVCVDEKSQASVPNVFAVGELTGIGGVDKAVIEGRLAGLTIIGNTAAAARLERSHEADLAFTRRLAAAFALRPELLDLAEPATFVCRCEDVTLAMTQTSISGRDAKLQTRCGMGPCQGRICGPILMRLRGVEPPQVRPPVFATPVQNLIDAGS